MYWYSILDTWKETLKIDLNFQHHQKNIGKFKTQTSLNFVPSNFVPSNKSGKLNVIFYINSTLMSWQFSLWPLRFVETIKNQY